MTPLSDSLETLLRNCTNLPSPPAIANKIIELSSCETSGLGDVADVVGLDPALSAKLMRMANSPLYAKQRKIENLRQAITLFGLEGTLNIALSFSLKHSGADTKKSGLDYNLYWKRSLAAAMLCQEIGQRLKGCSKDSTFLAGLLQDIGMLALDKAKPDLYKNIGQTQQHHEQLCQHETDSIGCDHSNVGAWLLSEWHLPAKIFEPVASSHATLAKETLMDAPDVSKAVACSCLLADIFISEDKDIQAVMLDAVNKSESITKISHLDFQQIIQSVSNNYGDLANMFDIELENPRMLEFISEQAKEVLILRNLNKIKETEHLQEAAEQLKSKAIELEEESRRDSLTKLHNRRHFDEAIMVEFENSRKHRWPLGVIFVDLDFFKRINDTFGHDAGDEVLVQASRILLNCMRDTDIVARYGGEEFTILLPGINREGVEIACNRIINSFHNESIQLKNSNVIHVTVSAGAVVYHGETYYQDWSELIRAADKAVYHAKENGRDQYHMNSEEEPSNIHHIAG